MDSDVQTKTPEKRRTKFIIIGLLAVILVLSFQLYKENSKKHELIRRKTFLIRRWSECRVDSEKMQTKYNSKKKKIEELKGELEKKESEYNALESQHKTLEDSFKSKTEDLERLKESAKESKNTLSALQEDYEKSVSSMKTMQGRLDDTIKVCDKHEEEKKELGSRFAQWRSKLEQCKQENLVLQEQNRALIANAKSHKLNEVIEEKPKEIASPVDSSVKDNTQYQELSRQLDNSVVNQVRHFPNSITKSMPQLSDIPVSRTASSSMNILQNKQQDEDTSEIKPDTTATEAKPKTEQTVDE